MAIDNGLIALVLILFAIIVVAAIFARAESARNDRYIESLRRLGSRCPDCRGIGWHFGPPGTGDPAISSPTCTTCKGTGSLASRDSQETTP